MTPTLPEFGIDVAPKPEQGTAPNGWGCCDYPAFRNSNLNSFGLAPAPAVCDLSAIAELVGWVDSGNPTTSRLITSVASTIAPYIAQVKM